MTAKYFTDDEMTVIASHIIDTSDAFDDIIEELITVAENSNTSLSTMLLALDTRIKLSKLKYGLFAQTMRLFLDESSHPSKGESQ